MSLLTEEDPGNESMCIVSILGVRNVAEADYIQLDLTSTASSIDGEQDRPCDQTAHETHSHRDFEIAQQEIAIQGVVIEDIAVWDLAESTEPIEHALWKIWGPLSKEMVVSLIRFEL